MRRLLALITPALAGALLATGCDDDARGGRLRVVATTTHAAEFARAVGGPEVEVHAMLRPGADTHAYEARPSDVKALSEAEVVVRSGGEIDEWLDDVVEDAGGDAATVTLLDAAGGDEPHFWLDPRRAAAAVRGVALALGRADKQSGDAYERRGAQYAARLRRLDRAIERCLRSAPSGRRKVVTSHDAMEPFARRYGVEVVGTIVPARSTSAQPSARAVDRLIRRMRRARVGLVLPEVDGGTRLERAVAREAGARIGPRLYLDSLAEGRDYAGTMRANAAAIAGRC